MKYTLHTILICLFILSSCEEKPASGPGTIATKQVAVPLITPSTTPANKSPLPVSNNIVTTTAPTAKLNPAHGQPGHRCDVAVGASLPEGSAPNANSAVPVSSVISPSVQATPTLQTKPATPVISSSTVLPGINPAHGQPGHRCDVAVGAAIPKTTAPAKTATTASPLVTPSLQNFPLTQPHAAAATTTSPANGLNPAHGQPGHRCDIEVGKPLNSAPKKK